MLLVIILSGGFTIITGWMEKNEQYEEKMAVLPQVVEKLETEAEKNPEVTETAVAEMQQKTIRMKEEKIGTLEGDFGEIHQVKGQQKILAMSDRFTIYSLKDAEKQREVVCDFPDDSFILYAFLDGEGNIWSLWQRKEQEKYELIQYREDGEQLKLVEIDAKNLKLEPASVQNMYADNQWIYMINREESDQRVLVVFDYKGRLVCAQEDVWDMEWMADGRLLIYCGKSSNRLMEVSVEDGQIVEQSGRILKMTGRGIRLYYAAEKDEIYLLKEDAIVRVKLKEEGEQPEVVFSFSGDALRISAEYSPVDFYVLENGSIYIIYYVYGGEKIGKEIWCYEPVEQREREKILTVSTTYPMPILDAAVKLYEDKYPDRQVKLETAYQSLEEYREYSESYAEAMSVRLMTGDYGDVLLSSHGIYSWDKLAGDAFEDLSGWVEGTENYQNLDQRILNAARVQGRMSGIPVALNHSYYVANEQLVLEADRNGDGMLTWSELLEQAKLWERDGAQHSLFGISGQVELQDLLASNLYDLIDPEKKEINLQQKWFLDLMEKWKKMQKSACLTAPEPIFDPSQEHVMYIGLDKGSMLYREYQFTRGSVTGSLEKDALGFYTDERACGCSFTIVKGIAGELHPNFTDFPMLFFSLNPAAAQRQAALDFLEILLSEEVQERLEYNLLPVSVSARKARLEHAKKAGVPLTDSELEWFYENMEKTVSQVEWLYSYGYYLNDLNEAMQEYADGKLDLKEAIAQAEEKMWIRMNE